MAMTAKEIFSLLRQSWPHFVLSAELDAIDPWIVIAPEGIVPVCRTLREEPTLSFDFLHLISAVDYYHSDPKIAAQTEMRPRLEVVYHLSSMRHRHRIVLKTELPRWRNGVAGLLPEIASVSSVWPTALWHEREVYDLSGVYFVGHPDLRRILCPEDWEGHPLRKDYVSPEEYHGIRAR